MSAHRNCAVFGCGNSGARLKTWMDNLCPVHECSQGRGICDCTPPFSLFPFPTDLQSSERRQQWIKLINRKDEKGKNWQPKSDSRVCSRHFPDGRPTSQNPNPTINLGYKAISSTKVPRKQPSVKERENNLLLGRRFALNAVILSSFKHPVQNHWQLHFLKRERTMQQTLKCIMPVKLTIHVALVQLVPVIISVAMILWEVGWNLRVTFVRMKNV